MMIRVTQLLSDPAAHPLRTAKRCGRARGFTLIEALLALAIAALMVALVITMLQRSRQRAAVDQLAEDLRVFSTAFQNYHQAQPSWPPSTNGENAIPRGMEAALKETRWLKGTTVGGNYGWVAPDTANASGEGEGAKWGGSGAIVVTAFTPSFPLELSAADLAYLDAKLDDGNLKTGRFRTGFNGWPVLLVGDKR